MAEPIALVLAGGGARGAYEIGALSVILPALGEDERPDLILGTSVGALNGAYLAATLPNGVEAALEDGRAIWEGIRWGDVLATPSLRDFERLLRGPSTSPACSRRMCRRCWTRRRCARRSSA
jgi:NTE family protein